MYTFSEKLLILGKVHWYCLNAANQLREKSTTPSKKRENGLIKFSQVHQTQLGIEVGNDAIYWWVNKREDKIQELSKRNEIALEAANTLKKATDQLPTRCNGCTLVTLIRIYEEFANTYSKEIDCLVTFAAWLYSRDELAPAILFNYRTWGSTRMSDRTVDTQITDFNQPAKIAILLELVLGLRVRNIEIIRIAKNEYDGDIEWDPSDKSYKAIELHDQEIEKRAAFISFHEFCEYIEQLRDSLRNIQIEIDKKEKQDRYNLSDEFWYDFITKAANSQKTEQQIWDFKETLEFWKTSDKQVKKEKAHHFAEVVAGFANHRGGVIVIGVTDKIPRIIIGIDAIGGNLETKMKHLRTIISNHISYDSEFVKILQIPVQDRLGQNQICFVVIIHQTESVISVKDLTNNSLTYPERTETGLEYKDPTEIESRKSRVPIDNRFFLDEITQFIQNN